MKRYRTTFERMNFGVNPPLKQSADVIFATTIPFENKTLEAFEDAAWAACIEQNPHFANPAGPAGVSSGWSSVTGGHKYTLVDEIENLAVVWHINAQSWLKQDGVTTTIDVEEAGRFNHAQIAELKKQNNGERFPLVAPKFWNEVEDDMPRGADAMKLEIVNDDFVLWGYGDFVCGDYLHVDRARTQLTDDISLDFELPEAVEPSRQPRVYQQRTSWAWRYNCGSGNAWNLATSKEDAMEQAKEFALKNMRSTWYHSCQQWFAFKHNVQVKDCTLATA